MKENHFFWNKLKIKKKYYPCLDFVVHLAYFIVFEVYVAAFYRRSQGWTELLRKTWNARPFSRQNSNLLLDQFNILKKQIHRYHKLSDPPPPTPQIKNRWSCRFQASVAVGVATFKREPNVLIGNLRSYNGKRHIKIELCVKLSLLRLIHVDHVAQNRRTALSLAWYEWF